MNTFPTVLVPAPRSNRFSSSVRRFKKEAIRLRRTQPIEAGDRERDFPASLDRIHHPIRLNCNVYILFGGGNMHLYGPKQLADSIRTVRKNTVLIAEDIPEEQYEYRPTADSRSVAESLKHIAMVSRFDRVLHEEEHVITIEGFDFGKLVKRSENEEKKPRSKAELVEWLRKSGEDWAQWVEGLPEDILAEQVRQPGGGSKTRFEMILGTKEHEMHHRAQLTVIERLLGIVPHLTRNRQAARAAATKRAS
jgi:uncharacterized damage-inducible protein DinB